MLQRLSGESFSSTLDTHGTRRQSAYRKAAGRRRSRHVHDVQGLVAQGRTIAENIEIARDIAKKLVEAQGGDAARIVLASNNGHAILLA